MNGSTSNKKPQPVQLQLSHSILNTVIISIFLIIIIPMPLITSLYVGMRLYITILYYQNWVFMVEAIMSFFIIIIGPIVIPLIILYKGIINYKIYSNRYGDNSDAKIIHFDLFLIGFISIIPIIFILELLMDKSVLFLILFIIGYIFVFIPNFIRGYKYREDDYWKYVLIGIFFSIILSFILIVLSSFIYYQLANFWNVSAHNIKDYSNWSSAFVFWWLIPTIFLSVNILSNLLLLFSGKKNKST
jgi:hypothetical protein